MTRSEIRATGFLQRILVIRFTIPVMLDLAKEVYGKFKYLGFAEIAALLKIARIKHLHAGEVLVKTGEWDHNLYTVIKGLLRNYIETSEGEEKTVLFTKEGMNTASSATVFHGKPANETIMAIEDSIVVAHDGREFEQLCLRYPQLIRLQNEALKMNMSDAVERIAYFTSMNPEERYVHFRNKYPDLLNRVPQIYLASYLGVHPVLLSRIRTRLASVNV